MTLSANNKTGCHTPGAFARFAKNADEDDVWDERSTVPVSMTTARDGASPTSQPARIEQTSDEPAHVDPASLPALRAQDAATGVR
jgi:hypothetical protein